MKKWVVCFIVLLLSGNLFAQEQLMNVAKEYLLKGDFEKAASTYKQLVEYNPGNEDVMNGYLQSLIGIKDFKTAEKIIKQNIKKQPDNIVLSYELSKIYTAQKEEKKANKLIQEILQKLPTDENSIKDFALLLEKDNQTDVAIQVYEKAKKNDELNPYLFAEELAILYNKKGDQDKAVQSLLDLYISRQDKSESVKATLQRMIENNTEKLDNIRQNIQKRAAKQPEIIAYPDLLAWLYIQQGDYDNAYTQIKSIDLRLKEDGRRILGFARLALREKKYSTSLKAYEDVLSYGSDKPFYQSARNEKLACLSQELKANPYFTKADVKNVTDQYAAFLDEFPSFKTKETMREYAELEARYAHDVDKAIGILQELIKAPQTDRTLKGRAKLDMGDYEIIRNNIWESTLLYSQVDKEFKQDMLGEEARFKNAKLSYYTGDFAWAQGQLDVLKASTSELIANDALNLSVLIVENNPPADSNDKPLLMFARAELLAFQHKYDESTAVLDSIAALYPSHPLADNILMGKSYHCLHKHDI
jgi:hypothetical protein